MDFGEVLTKAWRIIWKYKILWLFGIFASCSSGGGGGGGGGGSGAQYSDGDMPYGYYNPIEYIEPWAIALIIAAVFLLMIIVIAIVMAVSTVGRIGLVQGTQLADENEDAQVTFGGLFSSMKPYFWRVLGLNLLIGVGFFVLIMMFIFIGVFGAIFTFGLALICLLPLCCILIPVFWVMTTFVEMANVAVITEDLGVIDGLKRGWEVFRGNLGEMVLMGLVLVFGGMIVGMLLAMPMILTMIPLMMGVFAAIFGDANALAAGGVIVSGICCIAYLPFLIVFGGIIRAYIGAAWTLTYLRLTQGAAVEEPVELLPDEPVEPETLPEVVEEPVAEDDAPDKAENILPDDF